MTLRLLCSTDHIWSWPLLWSMDLCSDWLNHTDLLLWLGDLWLRQARPKPTLCGLLQCHSPLVLQSPSIIPKAHDNIDKINGETKFDVEHFSELSPYNITETKITSKYYQLDETINAIMLKVDGAWNYTKCDKTQKDKGKMRDHIEGMHIEGVSNPCSQCVKQFRSIYSLRNHMSSIHKQWKYIKFTYIQQCTIIYWLPPHLSWMILEI